MTVVCLGELAEVVQVRADGSALVRRGAGTTIVSCLTLDEALVPGDVVLCHSGFALERLTPQEADAAAEIRTSTRETP